jgi:RNA recognition motif-containing protein
MNIYVGNLDFKVNEHDLESLFGQYGEVSSVKLISDKYSGRSKGFGFVTMENPEEANKAIGELHGKPFKSRDLVVNEARPRKDEFRR